MPEQLNVSLIGREFIAKDTIQFTFKTMNGSISYLPGQHLQFIIPRIYDENKIEGTRFFTIIGDASDSTKFSIATRIRGSAFKHHLISAEMETKFPIFAPLGSFVVPDETRNLVLISADIGVTAMLPIVRSAVLNTGIRITFFYENSQLESVPFANELITLSKENENFSFYPHLIGGSRGISAYRGGRITDEFMKKILGDQIGDSYYMMSGPPSMVHELRKTMQVAGIPGNRLKIEIFSGYP